MELEQYLEIIGQWVTFDTVIQFFVIYIFIIWASLVIWVTKDITNRTSSLLLQILSVLLVLIGTPFGIFIYLLIRPSSTLLERYYEDEYESEVWDTHCRACDELVQNDFHFCPHCEVQLLIDCIWCQKSVRKEWHVCPYCGHKHESEDTTSKPKKKPTKKAKKQATK